VEPGRLAQEGAVELPSAQAVGKRQVARLEPPVLGRPGGWLLAAVERAEQVRAGDRLGEPVHHRVLDGQWRAGDNGER